MSVSIIIPTLNEEENVIRIYKKVYDVFQVLKINWEIIFVDDKSSDKTQEIINSLPKEKVSLIISKKRKGLGNAISLGWYRANLDYVLFLDCDSHVLNSDLINLINSKKLDHMVIGSRYLKKSKINGAPKIKVFFSRFLNILIGKFFKIKASDISHSLRILPNRYIEVNEILSHPGYFWALSKKVKINKLKISEIPITFNERDYGETKNSTYKMLISVLKSVIIISKIK